ncbi:hypothetical protein L3Q82_008127 [Scortum barcoo]|uniref:Uncharacterized protein n=1 Tax=Scortum barcoo TaxID=214431 RepID=A0ACB8WI05_9TELE|nr:hypothetical protein L3Q82_008127 [Scortum barcoo]
MATAGYDWNIEQINNKLKKLKRDYRDQKRELWRSGAGQLHSSISPYFDLFVLGDRPACRLTGTLNSATAMCSKIWWMIPLQVPRILDEMWTSQPQGVSEEQQKGSEVTQRVRAEETKEQTVAQAQTCERRPHTDRRYSFTGVWFGVGGVGGFWGFVRVCEGVTDTSSSAGHHVCRWRAGEADSVEECSLAVGELVWYSSVKSASRMNSAVVIFLDSVDKVNRVVESGVVIQGTFTPVLSLVNPC